MATWATWALATFGYLGQCDRDRIVSVCVAMCKVAKITVASAAIALATLELAILEDATQMVLFLFVSQHPRWPRQV